MTEPYLHATQTKLLLQVSKDLGRHEGFREFAYPDPRSKLATSQPNKGWGFKPAREVAKPGTNLDTGKPWTYGHGLTENVNPDSRITRTQSLRKMESHILDVDAQLRKVLTWYDDASFVTKTILINMAFNMGVVGLLGFKNTLTYVKNKQYANAAANMRKSKWYTQVTKRASELARRMETQEIPSTYKAPEKI